MKKNVAIVAGGYSSEIVISLKSAAGLSTFIDKERYNLYVVTLTKEEWAVQLPDGTCSAIDKNDFSFQEHGVIRKFDFAYITIHGTPGEDGRLQGYFDMIGMPYSSCDVLVSAVTFNKYVCNHYLRNFGVKVANSIRLLKGQTIGTDEAICRLGLPLFVKPNVGGSSFGTTKVKSPEQLQEAIIKAFAEGDEVILEQFIEGTEVTSGCYKTKDRAVLLPLTEVVTENEFFDFDAKYNGQVDEITPARLSPEMTRKIKEETSKIYDCLGASGLIRVDYIIPSDGEPVMLEVNTTPGMTATSFVPQQIRAAGLDIKEVMTEIIEDALLKRK
ncbi:MAG: D-alanine--D-alanine ligase [Massilibacteroides sp.]|nr:D-alanine--D-alanine ligase [Massilibacteroides sp.]MDD3063038.1 D-alanine--D-alanine ligase [Massilibacteroides sp.]MDD4114185.1 D-alanine--D-alanine ligase [Massilibacteroides sp.]MDD4660547.1 D-alanine--D-alanine ligase [Massilibacteroides sp.]